MNKPILSWHAVQATKTICRRKNVPKDSFLTRGGQSVPLHDFSRTPAMNAIVPQCLVKVQEGTWTFGLSCTFSMAPFLVNMRCVTK